MLLHVNTLEMSLFRFGHNSEASRLQVSGLEICLEVLGKSNRLAKASGRPAS